MEQPKVLYAVDEPTARLTVQSALELDGSEALCLMRDITERKAADEALPRSEAKLRQAQAVAKVGSWHLNVGSGVLEWSPKAYRMFCITQGTPLTYERFRLSVACIRRIAPPWIGPDRPLWKGIPIMWSIGFA